MLRELPFPVVAAVNGTAAGAGANVALACDIVLAARSASFVQAFAKIGLVPDCGGTWFLPRLLGPAPRARTRPPRRAAAGGKSGGLGPHLESGRRLRAAGGSAQALPPLRLGGHRRARLVQAPARPLLAH